MVMKRKLLGSVVPGLLVGKLLLLVKFANAEGGKIRSSPGSGATSPGRLLGWPLPGGLVPTCGEAISVGTASVPGTNTAPGGRLLGVVSSAIVPQFVGVIQLKSALAT